MHIKVPEEENPVDLLREYVSNDVDLNHSWLDKVWGKWPGDETIEELLAALNGIKEGG